MKYNKIFASELPAAIKAFVMKSFPKQSIAFAEKSVSLTGTGYQISLNDGTDLEFSPSGSCTLIHKKYEDFFPILL
jgi:hypothetical protein